MPTVNKKPQVIKKFDFLEQNDSVDGDVLREQFTDYAELVGMFILEFSSLEDELNHAIALYVHDDSDDTGYTIVEHLQMRNKISLFYKLYVKIATYKNHWAKKRIKVIRDELIRINTFRNNIAHANWQTLDKDGFVRTKILSDEESGFIKFQKVKITPEILIANIKAISDLVNKIDSHIDTAFNF